MASVDQLEATAENAGGAVAADGVLFNPRTYEGLDLDPASRRLMLATIDFFESRGKEVLKEHDHERVWYADFLEFQQAGARLRDPPDAGVRRGGRPGQALGHEPDLRLQRDHRLLRARLLVHVAGLHPRARADLAERERRRAAARGAAARGRRDLRLRAFREGARRRHLLDRHGPDPRRRRISRQRRQVLHRQREPRGDGVGVRPPRRRRGARGLRLLRRRQPAPVVPARQERRQLAVVRLAVRARGLPGARRRTSCTPVQPRSMPRSTRSTSASSISASPRSASASTPSTRRSRTPTRGSSTACASPTSHTFARRSPTPMRAWWR